MRQRVKLAQAIAHDPELLILDEPLSGMDPIVRRKTIRLIKDWGRAGKSILVSSHILHEIESMTPNILLINHGRILAEGNVHQIRDLIDEHPHTVYVKADDTRELARRFLADDHVLSLSFEEGAVVVQTGRPDVFYAQLTELAASGELGAIHEVTSPDDNLQAVFQYLVKCVSARPTVLLSARRACSTSRSGRCSGPAARSSSGCWSARQSSSLLSFASSRSPAGCRSSTARRSAVPRSSAC